MKTAKIKISFSAYSDANLENKAASILQNMTGNPAFTDPIPTLSELQAALTAYSAALLSAASLGRVNVAEKNKTRKTLELLLSQLGMYVMYIANGDEVTLTSSGYSLAKTPEPQYITNPGNVTLTNGITSGELVAAVKAVKGAVSYLHQYTPDPLTAESVWDGVPGSRSSLTFKNLEVGKKYWFRVAAVGSGQQIAYSPTSTQYVQ
ncbi:MAG: fibronectin type III domain-containing protein [Ferruginibacter sp.]